MYSYDNRGNISSVSDGTYTTTYTYDNLNQLIREDNEKNNRTYVYEYSNGNLLSRSAYEYTAPNVTPTGVLRVYNLEYTAYTWKDLLVKFDGVSLSYNGKGQIMSFNNMSLSWSDMGLLGSAGNTSFNYDTSGRRLSKTTNGTETKFYYAGDMIVGQKTGNNTLEFIYDSNGDYYGFEYNGVPYNYIKNLQGDVIAIADGSANILVRYEYDAWGRHLKITDTTGIRLGNINPIRYRGYYFDEETGFYYLKTRYYSPEICRFLSNDCVIDDNGANTQNLFAYARNNPVVYEDSNGLYAETALDIVAIGLDIVDIAANPNSPLAWGALGADIVGALLPGATGLGGVVRVVTTGDKLMDLTKYADRIVDFGQAIRSEKLLGTTYHSLYQPVKEGINSFLNKSIKTITDGDILSYLRPDAINNKMEVIYELKPNNVTSVIKGSNQVFNYLNKMNKQLNEWLVVLDLYF